MDSAEGAVDDVQWVYSLWVAYYEIYNEQVYDLLQPALSNRTKRRAALRLCEDSAGNSYVRGDCFLSIINNIIIIIIIPCLISGQQLKCL